MVVSRIQCVSSEKKKRKNVIQKYTGNKTSNRMEVNRTREENEEKVNGKRKKRDDMKKSEIIMYNKAIHMK